MIKPSYYEDINGLSIGSETAVRPACGETVEEALKRVKVRLAKYAADGRYFRARIDGDLIRVQRTMKGQNTKIADWLMMKAGDRLLLKSYPTPADTKKALDQCNYVSSVRWWRKAQHLPLRDRQHIMLGAWNVVTDWHGRLVVQCWTDVEGNRADDPPDSDSPLRTLWAGEWP